MSKPRTSPVLWSRLGPISTMLARVFQPAMPPVLIVSMPRSGSSWVGNVLGSADDALYLREPVTQSYLSTGQSLTVFEVDPSSPPDNYAGFADAAFAGQACFPRAIIKKPEQWSLRQRRRRRPVIKEVNPLALQWLLDRFDCQVIYLTRHPAAVAASYMNLGWTDLRLQERFHSEAAEKSIAELSGKSFWSDHGLFQGIVHNLTMQTLHQHPNRFLIMKYEQICASPLERFKDLFDFSGLAWNEKIEARIHAQSSAKPDAPHQTDPYSVARNSAEMINAWQEKVEYSALTELTRGYLVANDPAYPTEEWHVNTTPHAGGNG